MTYVEQGPTEQTDVYMTLMKLPQLMLFNPFGPVQIPKRMVWTSSSLRLFRKCKRRFFWKYLLRLRSKFGDKNLALGSAFHNCLGEWYKAKRTSMRPIALKYVAQLHQQLMSAGDYYDQEDLDKFSMMVNTFVGMMLGYEQRYNNDRHTWVIERESIEKHFIVNMGEFDFAGKMDLVAYRPQQAQNRFLVEHKTTVTIRSGYIDRLPLDTQIRGYIFGAKHEGYKINEVLYDIVRKCKLRRKTNETVDQFNDRVAEAYASDPSYWYREELRFSKSDLDLFEYELHQTNNEYKQLCKEKDPRAWLPNDGACDDYFRQCEFMKLCTVGLDKGTGMVFDQSAKMHDELDLTTGE